MMQRTFRALALGFGALAIASCSGHKDANAPLAFVPADTPYLAANLKPLDSDTRAALMKQADAQMPTQVAQMRHAAKELGDKGKPQVAALLNAVADEFDGRTVEQVIQRDGLDPDGLSALYGLGMSPVMRFQLKDPAAFEAMIGRLEKAYGQPMEKASIGDVDYRHTAPAGEPVQFVVAVAGKQAVLAMLPSKADQGLLRQALGLDRPQHSAQDAERLQKLADDKGYSPYVVGYVDFTRMPKLLTGGRDPLVKALTAESAEAAAKLPASCESDFDRIAARVPMASFGYTTLEARHLGQRVDVRFADDITKAFSGLKAAVPGLGGDLDAPFDLALSVPVKQVRQFWMDQADAVAAHPFTCPALTDLNQGFAKLRTSMQQAAVPPLGDLQGLRVSLDSFEMPEGGMPKVAGRILVASANPAGLLAMAQMAVPALGQVKLADDGKPVALPASLTAMAGSQPAWAAMTDSALAVGVGDGEEARLGAMIKAAPGAAGKLAAMHMDGAMYQKWVEMIADRASKNLQQGPAGDDAEAAKRAELAAQMKQNMDALRKQAARIERMDVESHFDADGLVISSDVRLH